MGFEKDLKELNKYKSIKCATKETRYTCSGYNNILYNRSHICPYYNVASKSCTINACIRGGVS